jgi:phytanoyl-CoA hydroxylase
VTPGALHPWNTSFAWQRLEVEPRRVTTDQVESFHRTGWLIIEDLLDHATVANLTADLDAIEADTAAFVRGQPDGRLAISESGAITFAPHLVQRSDVAQRLSRSQPITDLCHDLLGSDVRLYWDQLVYKHPDKPREFPWHQDNGYAYVDPQQYLTIWLALTDATVDNGCPWVAPMEHTRGTLAHRYVHPLGLSCFDDHPDATPAPVRAGGAVVFSSLTPHRTAPNTTDSTRKTYILQYAPDGAEVLLGDPAAGPPADRVTQNNQARQYTVLRDGAATGADE